MLRIRQSSLRLVLVILVCFFRNQPLAADDSAALTKEQIKQFLLTAKIVGDQPAKKGVTDTRRLTLSDGTITHDASFQPIDEHTPLKKFADGHTEVRFADSY